MILIQMMKIMKN